MCGGGDKICMGPILPRLLPPERRHCCTGGEVFVCNTYSFQESLAAELDTV